MFLNLTFVLLLHGEWPFSGSLRCSAMQSPSWSAHYRPSLTQRLWYKPGASNQNCQPLLTLPPISISVVVPPCCATVPLLAAGTGSCWKCWCLRVCGASWASMSVAAAGEGCPPCGHLLKINTNPLHCVAMQKEEKWWTNSCVVGQGDGQCPFRFLML